MKKLLDQDTLARVMESVRAARRRVDAVCEVCGTVTPGAGAKRRYCSPKCSQKAYRERQRERETAPSGERS